MKKAMGLVIFFVFLFFVSSVIQNVFAGSPKLLIPETTFDFGYTPTKSTVSHYYLVKNVGTDSLKIENVKPG
ncbi:MAG: hypothetical protein ABII96_07930 [Candidatus Zixiibacteriota bacterium]